jgi:hypothetical protein
LLIRISVLAELADQLNGAESPLTERWDLVETCFESWVGRPDLLGALRTHLLELSPEQAYEVSNRSRETTTHFAWCLRDLPGEQFTFWLHEYKPQRDWRPGYADSVHNHRYHFCTTIVRGGYLHEAYRADVDPITEMITGIELRQSTPCEIGDIGSMLSSEFHRIPIAQDTTMTFLVKSRAVRPWSLSYDPATRTSHRHIPVESRLGELASSM